MQFLKNTSGFTLIRRSARIQAEEAYQKGDYDTAILNLERILFFYPNDKEIKAEIDKIKQEKLQAVAPEEKQDLRRWVNDAQKAIQMRDIEVLPELYEKIKSLHETEPVLSQIEEVLDQNDIQVQFEQEKVRLIDESNVLGEKFLKQSHWRQAIASFDKVLQLDPNNKIANQGVQEASQAIQREEEKKATPPAAPLPAPPAAIELKPEVQEKEKKQDEITALMEEGKQRYQRKEYESSIKSFEGVFEFSPENKEASKWIDKAKKELVKSKDKMFEETKTELDKQVKASIDDSIEHAKQLIEQGRLNEAQVELDRIQLVDSDNKQIKLLTVFLRDKQKEIDALHREAESQNNKEQLIHLAQTEFRSGNLMGARILMEKVVKLDPSDAKANNSLKYIDEKMAQELMGLRTQAPVVPAQSEKAPRPAKVEKTAAVNVAPPVAINPEEENYLKELETEYEAFRSAQQASSELRQQLKEKYQILTPKPMPPVSSPTPPALFIEESTPPAPTASEPAQSTAVSEESSFLDDLQKSALEMQDDYSALIKEQARLSERSNVTKTDPDLPQEILIDRAIRLYKEGRLEQSKAVFEQVIKQDPTDRKAAKSIEIINQKLLSSTAR
jgi:tetratricopeptide (TPR) repeat protein